MYVLNENIRIGDIILIDSNSLIATGIKVQANGEYSHAAIVISESQAIEALGGSGVQISSLLRFEVDDVSNLAVYRTKDIDQEKFTQLFDKAIKHQTKGYDLVGTLKSIFLFSQSKENKFFCSELVAHLYNEMGIKLFEKENAQVKPNDFARCDKLTNVSSKTISKLSPYIQKRYEKRPHLWRPLDKKHSSVSPDALRHQKFLEGAKKVFKKRNLDIPNNMNDIMEIITRPSEDGNFYLSIDLNNELVTLHDDYRILEELEADIIKALELDLDDYISELDELGVKIAIQELVSYENLLIRLQEKVREKTEETFWIGRVAKKFPLTILKARVTYSYMSLEGLKQIIEKNIKPTIMALKEHITKHRN